MSLPASSNWFICTISSGGYHNWTLCKEVGLWGIPSNGRNINMNQISAGDHLLFYWATKGLMGLGECTDVMRRPQSKDEAPWAGGIFRFGVVIPFDLSDEIEVPAGLKFKDGVAIGTNLKVASLRRGFSRIESSDGTYLADLLKSTRD